MNPQKYKRSRGFCEQLYVTKLDNLEEMSELHSFPSGWGTLRMNGIGEIERERRHVRPALIGPSLRMKRERERERERERDQTGGVCRVWQSLAMFYFLPWLLYPKLVHF